MKRLLGGFALSMLLLLSGCGRGSKQDIVKKTSAITKKADLEKALGKPDEFNKAVFVETWTYKASDGEVTFIVTGDTVQMQVTGGDGKNR